MGSCPSNSSEHAHMKMRQSFLVKKKTAAEKWAEKALFKTGIKWSRERIWRWRVYDFWNHDLGCAVEIDGPEHDKVKDSERDLSDYERSGIIVLRVRNFNETDMLNAIEAIKGMDKWMNRRASMGLLTKSQAEKW